ncbi:hypothetical protein CY35_06G093900 [Sphagnum magellanicum]|nr:hypothetical protein CY35_06G093900 [Sphagnum magellanicum]
MEKTTELSSAEEGVSKVLERGRLLQEEASSLTTRWTREADLLSQQAVALLSDITSLKADINNASEKDDITQPVAQKLEEELYKLQKMMYDGDTASLLPSKANGYFLRMLLGSVNVRATRKDGRYKVKEEYNAYRDRTAVMFLAFPVILLILKNQVWNGCFPALPVQVYQSWLLFFYTSLALRENILRVNGSDIRPWWVYHHYCAMLMALVSLTWGIQGHPSCTHKQQGVRLFLGWAVMQGVAMLLQNRYQRQRLYTRIALGKGFQFFIGLLLLRTAILEVSFEWQVVACGLLLIIMAVGNFVNTVATLVAKAKIKAKMKKKGKQMLHRMTSKKVS